MKHIFDNAICMAIVLHSALHGQYEVTFTPPPPHQHQPSTAMIAAANFANMAHCMINIACDPYNKDNVALQLHQLVQGMANIAIAGSRALDHHDLTPEKVMVALETPQVHDTITDYIVAHHHEITTKSSLYHEHDMVREMMKTVITLLYEQSPHQLEQQSVSHTIAAALTNGIQSLSPHISV